MSEELRARAEKILSRKGITDAALYEKDLESLVEELSIFQIELEHQNDALLHHQEELRKTKDQYLDLFNSAPVGYIIIRKDHRISNMNATACEMLEMERAELIDQPLEKIIHPDYQDFFYVHFREAEQSKRSKSIDVKVRRGTAYFYVRLICAGTHEADDADDFMKITLIDIDVQKELEIRVLDEKKRAELSEMRWRFAVDGSGVGLWDWDMISNEVFYSKQWKDNLGYMDENLPGIINVWKDKIHPDDAESVLADLATHEEGSTDLFFSEHRVQCRNQSYRWMQCRAKVVTRMEDGTPLRMIGTMTDITEQKKVAEAIIQSQRMNALGELAASIAHDFNNALQGIMGSAEIALLSNELPLIQECLQTIKKSSKDGADRIRKLQRFAGSRNTESEGRQVHDLNELIKDSIKQTRNLWKGSAERAGKYIEVKTAFSEGAFARVNASEIRTIFYNLIKNAIEAMPDGGTLSLKTKVQKQYLYMQVSDTGKGMDEYEKKRIFQPFFSTKGFAAGKGLGLSSAYSAIKEHQGQLSIKSSAPGQGTTMEIRIPKSMQDTPDVSLSALKPEPVASIIWVDDEETILTTGKAMLNRLGHNVDIADNGMAALKLLAKNDYDIIITDLSMPDMNGLQLCEKIPPRNADKKIILLTGWNNSISAEESSRNHNIFKVYAKPVSFDGLKDMIAESLTAAD